MSHDVDDMLKRVRQFLDDLHAGQIVSWELGLLKVGAVGAFEVAAIVSGGRLIEIRTDLYPRDAVTTDISLLRHSGDDVYHVTTQGIQPLVSIPDAIEVCGQIRQRIQDRMSFEDAIGPFW